MIPRTSRCLNLSVAGCVLMMVVACSDAATTPKPPTRTNLSAVSRTNLSGTVGEPVDEAPSVIVRDSAGNPVAGVFVSFTVMEGGGVAQIRGTSTDSRGIADVARWTLGKVPGRNTLTARSASGDTVGFIANAVVGPPAVIAKVVGDRQTGPAGATLRVRPRVRVSDVWNNPLAGVAVTFAVEAGGGSVSGGPAVTDSTGIATSGDWVLGSDGSQRLAARVGSIAAEPFSARIIPPPMPCAESVLLKAETPTRVQLSALGCNQYTIIIETMGTYTFAAGSSDFDTTIQLRDSTFIEVAGNDDSATAGGGGTTNSGFSALLIPGTYTLSVSSSKPGTSGTFDVRYNFNIFVVDGCAEAFIVRGASVLGTTYSGCAPEADNPADRWRVYLEAGDPIDVQVEDWSYSGPNIRVITPDGGRLEATPGANYLTTLHATAPVSGYYLVMVGLAHESGLEYKLWVR